MLSLETEGTLHLLGLIKPFKEQAKKNEAVCLSLRKADLLKIQGFHSAAATERPKEEEKEAHLFKLLLHTIWRTTTKC